MGWVYNVAPEVNIASDYPGILGVCFTFTFLMVIVVSLRFYVRFCARRMAADDYVMIVTMVTLIPETRYGLGLPLRLRPKESLPQYTKINFAGRPFYQMGIAGFKAALCLSYLRLLSGTSRRIYRILIWAVLIVSTLGHLAGMLLLLLNCQPVHKSWDPDVEGICLPFGSTHHALAGWSILCDLVVIFLPIPLLVKLKVKTAQKAGLVCLFLLGLFTTVCSVFRLTQIHEVAYGDGDSTLLILLGTVELNVGNIVTCLPFLGPLLKRSGRDFRPSSDFRGEYSHYALQPYSRDSHPLSTAASHRFSRASKLKGAPSEDLVIDGSGSEATASGAIKMTLEYRVSVDKNPGDRPEPCPK
ncbi:hypothetical protein BDV29DRAFT_190617 [Aspergillus leporis]|uniref:Rhodopsin domain-containing protein n=1 Tax=Aspergillus leporis TaxID=41062 RepID=A0A5N5X4B9_9EURO|nr:hypothetical protein BDV29DRAFT_190617 [Aspergillus leporis]